MRATVVTRQPRSRRAPSCTENGQRVAGLEAENLGRGKSVVVAVDRSQSHEGQALADASAAARAFVRLEGRADRVAVVAVGDGRVLLTGFSSSRIDADAALRTMTVDGGAERRSTTRSSSRRRPLRPTARPACSSSLTDGQEVTSKASLKEAIDAALDAGVAVYPIAIESPSFSPRPLRQLAEATGGRYSAPPARGALARDLRLARPGAAPDVAAQLRDERRARANGSCSRPQAPGRDGRTPGTGSSSRRSASKLPDSAFALGTPLVARRSAGCVLRPRSSCSVRRSRTGSAGGSPRMSAKRERKSTRGQRERFAAASV